jgi:hypothetical protein
VKRNKRSLYDGKPLKQAYRPDFVCVGKIIIAITAVHKLGSEQRAFSNILSAVGTVWDFRYILGEPQSGNNRGIA